eukprot:NODE_27_length_33950_cov_0.349739.p5 type:complete len:717 gc:universal NODE_27_length_33950_cov_0.349739:13214-15364(+)
MSNHCALHSKFSSVCFYCIMRLNDPEKTSQLTSNLQQLHTQSSDLQLSWLNAIKQSIESMHSTVFMKWLTTCYLLESCFEMFKFNRSTCFALDILDDFVVLLPCSRVTRLCITNFSMITQLTSSENVTIRASVCRLLYSIGIHLPVFTSIDTVKLTLSLLAVMNKQASQYKLKSFERDVILPMSTDEEMARYIPRYVQIMQENCMMTLGMVIYGRVHDIPHNHLLISSIPHLGNQLLKHVQERRPSCYPESQKSDVAASALAALLQLPLYDEVEDFDDEDWSNAFSNLEKTCTTEFIQKIQVAIKSLLLDTPENIEKMLKKQIKKKHKIPRPPNEEDHAKAVESTHRALISLVSILCNLSFFSDLTTRILSTIPTLLYIVKEKHIPKPQAPFYRNILNDLCLAKGVHRDPNFHPSRFLLNSFSAPLRDTTILALLRIRRWLVSVSPDSAESGVPVAEVSQSPFSDIPLEMWSPDTAYLLYQQAKQLSMTCRRRGNFAFADKDCKYAACQYTSALLLTSFEEEDLLIRLPPVKSSEPALEFLPPMLYFKSKRVADRFIFKSNRAECWLRVQGMHDRANLDASNAIEEMNMMVFELAEMFPLEQNHDKSDQLAYRSLLVGDDLWEKNERRIKRADECFLAEKRQEQDYYNEINAREEMVNGDENEEYIEEDSDLDEVHKVKGQEETDYSSDEFFEDEKTREIQQIIAASNGNKLGRLE